MREARPYSLEHFQRDAFGLVDDQMEFNERTLAAAVRQELAGLALSTLDSMGLLAIADALDNDLAEWKLQLVAEKTGGRKLHHHQIAQDRTADEVFILVMTETARLGKRESAISLACVKFGISRSTVFKLIRGASARHKRMQEVFDALGIHPSSPNNSEN